MTPYMFFSAMVTPGAVMVFQHRHIDQDIAALGQNLRQPAAHAAIRNQILFVIRRDRCRSIERRFRPSTDRKPARSSSSLSRSQTTMSPALIPACCSRSQMASTSCRLLESPRPPSAFTFSPTMSPGRTSLLHASTRMVAVEERLHGAVQQGQHPARIHRGTRAAQQVVARDDNLGFRGAPLVGLLRAVPSRRLRAEPRRQ